MRASADMKTLHLTNAYHSTSGGIRTFYRALLEAAEEEGREMALVVPGVHSGVEHTGRFGRIYTLEAPRAPAFDRRYRMILPHRYFPLIGRELVGILERERPTLVEIFLTGSLDRETLATVYASCDVFVHPNAREPFGIGPLEAMASGVPVVVPASGGVLEYANPLNAWLAAPTVGAFARAVRAAAAADPRRLAAARATAQRFRWSQITRRFFATYDELHRSMLNTSVAIGAPLISSYSYVISSVDRPNSRSDARDTTRVGTAGGRVTDHQIPTLDHGTEPHARHV